MPGLRVHRHTATRKNAQDVKREIKAIYLVKAGSRSSRISCIATYKWRMHAISQKPTLHKILELFTKKFQELPQADPASQLDELQQQDLYLILYIG